MTEVSSERLKALSREEKARLFELLRAKKEQEPPAARARIARRDPAAGPPPLSFAQQRLWFLDRLSPGDPTYNIPGAFQLLGLLELRSFVQALAALVERHEGLRTTFAEQEGQPVQVIHRQLPPLLLIVDLRRLAGPRREAELLRLGRHFTRVPFDLTAGPLLRLLLVQNEEESSALLFSLHHIAGDGWSLGVLIAELSALYRGVAGGTPVALPELPIQYADFASWQREWLSGDLVEQQLAVWRRRLAGAPEGLDLPLDRRRPARRGALGGNLLLCLPPEVTAGLAAVAKAQSATLFMSLFAAFATVLGRLAGQEDLVVGTAVANRTRPEVAPLIGFFVNTLALRLDLGGDPTFAELVARARAVALEAFANQDLPFEKLLDDLQLDRSTGRSPLFDTMLVLQNASHGDTMNALAHQGGASLPLDIHTGTAKFDLTLSLSEVRQGLSGFIEYAAELFEASTIGRFVGYLQAVAAEAGADPERRLSELAFMPEPERHQLLVAWNETAAPYPRGATVAGLVLDRVARDPEAPAVSFGGDTLTYTELARVSSEVAARLARQGVGTDDRVAVLAERSLELIPSLLGILRAGAAYVALDPAWPRERLAFLLADSRAKVLVGKEESIAALPAGLVLPPVVALTPGPSPGTGEGNGYRADLAEIERVGASPSPVSGEGDRGGEGPLHSASLACLMYTSGTTGVPKGVAVTHQNVVRLVAGLDAYAPLGHGDAVLHLAPLSFDASTFEIWGALGRGARVVVAPPGALSLDEVTAALAKGGVTALWLTAGLFHSLVERRVEELDCLRFLLAGGDVLSPPHVELALAALPGCRLINGYGPTEGTTFTTCHVFTAGAPAGDPVPLGRPIPNTRAYVVDTGLRPAPIGVVGELWAGGDGLARGYLGRSDLTAERFVPDPFGAEPGGRLYRTGDQIRVLASGLLEFVGRRDGQVKIRGFRVELGEIEAALTTHPAVAEAVVLAPVEDAGSRRLAAFVVPRSEAPDDLEALLRSHLAARLPEPFLPRSFVRLEALPLTANGKVDRRALAAMADGAARDTRTAAGGEDSSPPRTPPERAMAELWAEVLGVPRERLGVADSFFELGGHSLLATRLASRIRDRFEVELPLAALFEEPTIAGLCRRLSGADTVAGEPIPRAAVPVTEAPLSASQERLWFLYRLDPRGAAYNMPLVVRLDGRLDRAALTGAFAALVERHGSLRTTFHSTPSGPVQRVAPFQGFRLPTIDLGALPDAPREGELHRLAAADARLPFDLATGPIFRPALVRLGEREHALFATMHHIVSDGWSQDLFVGELVALYKAGVEGWASPLAPLPLQYTDFAVWQRGREGEDVFREALAGWKERLTGAPPALDLPTEFPRPPLQTFAGKSLPVYLEAGLAGRVRRLAHASGTTQFMLLLAALGAVLARYTGQTDMVLGAPVAGRTRRETEGLIGIFLNSLALRLDLAGDPSFGEALTRAREATLAAFAHQEVPIERLLEEIKPERDLSRTPLFQVVVNWLAFGEADREPVHLPELTLAPLSWGDPVAKFDLEVYAGETADGIALNLVYNRDLFGDRQMEALAGHLRAVLEAASSDPGRRLSDLPLALAADLLPALAPGTEWPADPSWGGSIGDRFRFVAGLHPERPAVVSDGGTATYGELLARAERVALALLSRGLPPNSRVALHLSDGLARAQAILGTLLAGFAYVPLDPSYPEERLAGMVRDAGAVVCVVSRTEGEVPHGLFAGLGLMELENLEVPPAGWAPPVVPPEALAYLLYTSGSTGEPKGVMQSHAGVLGHVRAYAGRLGLTLTDRLTLLPSYGFDAAVMDLFGALLSGASLHPWDVRTRGVAGLGAFLAEQRITVWHSTPTVLRAFLDTRPDELPHLRLAVLGGEEVTRTDALRLTSLLPGVRMINGLGPTESTLALQHEGVGEDGRRGVPIGRPVPAMRAALETAAGPQPALWGTGEIGLASPCLARGYWQRPDLTADAFRPDPETRGGRLYRTGDLGRLLPGGLLEFAGRRDAQVKVRGFRVEPGEIEAALARLPGVAEAAVAVRRRPGGEIRLFAYAVPAAGTQLTPASLQEGLRGKLPAPMMPAAFVVLDRLPQTPTGKVDRRALSEPTEPAEQLQAALTLPASDLERTIARVWQSVLEVERVGTGQSFFDLGGHSLLLLTLHARLQETLGRELALVDLFTYPTVRSFAEHLTRQQGESTHLDQAKSRANRQIEAANRQRELAAARRGR